MIYHPSILFRRVGSFSKIDTNSFHISHRFLLFLALLSILISLGKLSYAHSQKGGQSMSGSISTAAMVVENKRLKEALELEKLRSRAFDTMIDVAEKNFNIPIRKKAGTKQ